MRLTTDQAHVIRQTAQRVLGAGARVSVTLRYLPEHAENALLALDLARKEAAHLQYTHRTLFELPIDALWVQQLETRPDLAEKVDAYVSRFGRLQGHIGEKLIPRFTALLGESPKSMLDVLA